MIGGTITSDKDGNPLDNNGQMLAVSQYQPPDEVKSLFARVQKDYQTAYMLQHRSFDEFDGYSLLERTRLDQQLFGAFVGCEYVPSHKRWRWKGRKNTSRNKIIEILSRMIAGILYPVVSAKNSNDEEDKMTARVMRILVEEKLKKAKYEMKFLFMVLSALVHPATFVDVDYVEQIQKVKLKLSDGSIRIVEAIDELLSGLALSTVPIDEMLLPDFYSGTGSLQNLPNLIRLRRIPYDQAVTENKGRYFYQGKDLTDYIQAGKTKVFIGQQENQLLYDIDWTEADKNYVQELTIYYRPEDIELKWIGGVGIFNYENPYNSNPFKHRRMTLIHNEWISIPVYKYAMSGFEPLDPAGRFAYYKSAAFKEYWDDAGLNKMYQLVHDATYLDVIKVLFTSGAAKVDQNVMVPGAQVAMPKDASVTAFSMSPNIPAAFNVLNQNKSDISDSTQITVAPSEPQSGVSATQTNVALMQAKVFITSFSFMIADLVKQVGELAMDCVVMNSTIGEIDTSVPEALRMKFKPILAKGKDKGKEVTNKVIFTDEYMGQQYTQAQIDKMEWALYEKTGGEGSDQRIYMVNPYLFARATYTMEVDPDQIVQKSMGAERSEKDAAFARLTDPRVLPYVDAKNVVNDFVIEEYGGSDPDRYKKKSISPDDMLNNMGMISNDQSQAPLQSPYPQTFPQMKNTGVVVPGGK